VIINMAPHDKKVPSGLVAFTPGNKLKVVGSSPVAEPGKGTAMLVLEDTASCALVAGSQQSRCLPLRKHGGLPAPESFTGTFASAFTQSGSEEPAKRAARTQIIFLSPKLPRRPTLQRIFHFAQADCSGEHGLPSNTNPCRMESANSSLPNNTTPCCQARGGCLVPPL